MTRQIVRGVVASGIYTAAVVISGVVQLRIIIQFLPVDQAGLWLLFLTIGSYSGWFDIGMSPTFGREVSFIVGSPKLNEEERTGRIAVLLITLWHLFRVIAVSIGAVSIAIGEVAIRSSAHYGSNQTLRWCWVLFSVGVSLNLLGGTALAGLFSLGRVATEKAIRSVAICAGLIAAVVSLKLGWGLLGLAVAWALQASIVVVFGYFQLRRTFPQFWNVECAPNWKLARTLMSPSLKFAFIQLGAILILQSANPLIAIMVGPAAIPRYETVSKMAATMMTAAVLVVNSSAPFLSMSYAAGELHKFKLLLVRNLRLGMGLMIIMVAFAAINGDRIVSVWLGPDMFPGFGVLWVLLVMVLLEVHHVIFVTAAMAAGQIVFMWVALGAGVLNIGLAISLAGRFGLMGIAVAVTVAQLLTNNWYVPFYTIRFIKIPVAKLLRDVWVPAVGVLIIQLSTNVLLKQVPWLGGPSLIALVASFAVSTLTALAMFLLLALKSQDDRQALEWLPGWRMLRLLQA